MGSLWASWWIMGRLVNLSTVTQKQEHSSHVDKKYYVTNLTGFNRVVTWYCLDEWRNVALVLPVSNLRMAPWWNTIWRLHNINVKCEGEGEEAAVGGPSHEPKGQLTRVWVLHQTAFSDIWFSYMINHVLFFFCFFLALFYCIVFGASSPLAAWESEEWIFICVFPAIRFSILNFVREPALVLS